MGGSLGVLAVCRGAGACATWCSWQREGGHHGLGFQSSLNSPPHSGFSSSCLLPATGLRWTGLHQGMLVAKIISSIFFSKPLCPPGQAWRQLKLALQVASGRELASPLRKLGAGPAGPFACGTPWMGVCWMLCLTWGLLGTHLLDAVHRGARLAHLPGLGLRAIRFYLLGWDLGLKPLEAPCTPLQGVPGQVWRAPFSLSFPAPGVEAFLLPEVSLGPRELPLAPK